MAGSGHSIGEETVDLTIPRSSVTCDRWSQKAWQVQGVLQWGFQKGKAPQHHCNLTGTTVEQCIFTECRMAAATHIHSIHGAFPATVRPSTPH